MNILNKLIIKTFKKWHFQSKIPRYLFCNSNYKGFRVENEVQFNGRPRRKVFGGYYMEPMFATHMAGLFPYVNIYINIPYVNIYINKGQEEHLLMPMMRNGIFIVNR